MAMMDGAMGVVGKEAGSVGSHDRLKAGKVDWGSSVSLLGPSQRESGSPRGC